MDVNVNYKGAAIINLKLIKSLRTKKGRDELGLFIIEGEKWIYNIPKDWTVITYVCSELYSQENKPRLSPLITVSNQKFSGLTDTITPQGIMAVVKKRVFTTENLPLDNRTYLIGERLSDPGNIGTLIRTAAAAGAGAVILSPGSGDVYNPKVIRASAGTSLLIPVIENALLTEIIPILKKRGVLIAAAHLKGAVLPYELDLSHGCAFLIGSEAHGLSVETAALADASVKLPMARNVESLNASVAGGILLYEAVRQFLARMD